MSHFFENLRETTNTKLVVIVSESLRCNGRATQMGDTCVVTLPMLFERYGNEFRDEYVKWLSQETLDECDKNLSNEQKVKLRECFEL